MKTILFIWLFAALLSPVFVFLLNAKYKREQSRLAALADAEEAAEEAKSDEELKVLTILRAALKSLDIQHCGGYGPWLPALIEKGDGDPGAALLAVRWTIRDIMNRPSDCDAPHSRGPHYDLGGLVRAERALEELTGTGA